MKPKAVFFDLDGTLANSLLDLAASTNHILALHGYPIHEVAAYQFFAGDGIPKMIERALPEAARSQKEITQCEDEYLAYYADHFADCTVPYDGLYALIYRLKEKGIKLAVITNKAQEMAEKVVSKLFGDVFDIVLGMQEGIPAKPDPTGAFMLMRQMGVQPEDCAFVGDTAMDILAGVKAGAFPIGVLWGFRNKAELQQAGAKAFAANATELEAILLGEDNG